MRIVKIVVSFLLILSLPLMISMVTAEIPVIAEATPSGSAAGIWNPATAIVALAICGVIAYIIFKAGLAPNREVDSWYCGGEFAPELVRYRSHGFVLPFKQAFGRFYPSLRESRQPCLFGKLCDTNTWFYDPAIKAGEKFARLFSTAGLSQAHVLWQVVGVLGIGALFLIVR
jgi:hypothetical protein